MGGAYIDWSYRRDLVTVKAVEDKTLPFHALHTIYWSLCMERSALPLLLHPPWVSMDGICCTFYIICDICRMCDTSCVVLVCLACGRRTSISFIYVKYLLSYASWTQMSKALGWISTLEQKPLHCHKSCCMKVCNRCDNVKKKKLPQRRETNTLFPYQSRVDRKPQSSVMSNGMQFFSFIE